MKKAHRFEPDNRGALNVIFGKEAEGLYKQNRYVFDNDAIYSPVNGDPMTFALRYKISSHFRRDTTWGEEHALSTLHPIIGGGEKTLIVQDKNVFSYKKPRDFRGISLPGPVWPLREWIAAVGGKFVPAYTDNVRTTVLEARKAFKNRTLKEFDQECFVYYGGIVRPFSSFFHDWNRKSPKFPEQHKRLVDFFSDFSEGKYGLHVRREETPVTAKETRAIDTPALFRASRTRTGLDPDSLGIKVNPMIDPETHLRVLTMIWPRTKALADTKAYKDFREGIALGRQYWVQGTASVSWSVENVEQTPMPGDEPDLKTIRVVVNDFSRQVAPVGVLDLAT